MTTDTTTPTAAPDPIALTPTEAQSLHRWLKSKGGPIRSYAMTYRAAGDTYRLLPPEPTLPTASWRPEPKPAAPAVEHQFRIGLRAPAAMPTGAQLVRSRRLTAMRAMLRHEAAHAAHTDRTFARTIVPLLRRANVPFQIFNLMEDARIESLTRTQTGEPFGWTKHLAAPPKTTDNPTAYFYALTHAEEGATPTRWTGSAAEGEWIRVHYARTVSPTLTPSTHAAAVRALEFAQQFALSEIQLPEHRTPAAPDGAPDPTHIPTPAPDAASTLSGSAPDGAADTAPANPDDPRSVTPHSTGGTPQGIQTELLRDLPATFLRFARLPSQAPASLGDAKRTSAELAAMARRAGVTPSRLGNTGHRIHAAAVAVGAEAAFRRPAPDKGPRRLCLIIDMSGSMSQTFRDHAAAFVAAALELNRSRALAVDVWLSQSGAAAKLPANTPSRALANLGANSGGEGLSNCMRAAAADMAAASAVVVYTDGELGDDKLPRRANGADIIGAVCAPDSQAPSMQRTLKRHFDRALVATTPHSLAREIVRYVLTRP